MTHANAQMSKINADLMALFDLDWYEHQTKQPWPDKQAAIADFMASGWKKGFDPHPLFSSAFYLERYPDVREAGMPPLLHFAVHGHAEGRDPHPMFSVAWYRQQCPAVDVAVNPLVHYLVKGSKAGVRPSPDFDPIWYARAYAGQIQEGMEPLVHFITEGTAAGFARNQEEEWALIEAGQRRAKVLQQARQKPSGGLKAMQSFAALPVTPDDLINVQLLSLDIWDTILRRDCYSDEIKLQSARYVYLTCYWDIRPAYRNISALLRRRLQVENSVAPKRDFEYRFSAAAARWLTDVLEPGIPREQIDQLRDALLEHEFQAECRSIRVDQACREFLTENVLPPTIFTSDFYLESHVLMRLLETQGLSNVFVRGYSSCDDYKNKRSGELFRKIIDEFAVDPASILHVGDNPNADVSVPQSLGIRCAHYTQPVEEQNREAQRRAFEGILAGKPALHHCAMNDALDARVQAMSTSPTTDLEAQGALLAPIAVSFVLHILETALQYRVTKIFFFTREGQFLKELYERIVKLNPYNLSQYPEARLLEVSRVSTFAASLRSIDTSELMRLWNQYSKQSLRAFCKSLNFDVAMVKAAAQRQGLDLDEVINMPWEDFRFQKVLQDEAVSSALSRHVEQQRAALSAYLTQAEFLDGSQAAVIVDIGWRGTIQDNLCYLTNKHVHGCYLGLFRLLNQQPSNSSKHGWLVDYNKHEYCWEGEDIAPLEMLFNGLGGSVVDYEHNLDGIRALRRVIKGEEAVIETYVRPIQDGLLAAAETVCSYVRLHGLMSGDIRDLARAKAQELLMQPPQAIAHAFFNLEHNEQFGTGETTTMSAVAGLRSQCSGLTGHRLHGAALTALKNAHWKPGLLSLERDFFESLDGFQRNSLPLEFGQHYRASLIGRHGFTPRMAIYAPAPIIGSGGHRTIFNIARRIKRLGVELFVYLEAEGAGVGCVEEYLQGTPAHISIGWNRSVPVDFALATIAHSAAFVAEHPCPFKGYLVQDFEAGFNPLSDSYVAAENSYCHGLQHFTIGNWLTHVLRSQYGVNAIPAGLGVDTEIYRPLTGVAREDAVCFLYQPDKPRRTPILGINALRRLKRVRPDIKIYVYGSDLPLHYVDFEVENLGLIRDINQINALYNRCKVGLCISLSNPSRIPYEMMAAGTVPVDVYRYNNLLDHEAGTSILAYQGDASLAQAMLHLFEDEEAFQIRSKASAATAQSRTLLWEQDVISNSIADMLSHRPISKESFQTLYTEPPLIADEEKSRSAISFCQWQERMASL